MRKDLERYLKKKIMRAVLTPLKIIPIKKTRIFLINDLGKNYSCNLKSISEYFIKYYPNKYDIIFSVANPEKYKDLSKFITFVKYNSIKYFFYIMTSRVIVSNSGGYSYVPHRKKQTVINTHHGGGAYKKAGLDMFGDTYWFRKDMQLFGNSTDIFLSTNRVFSDVISKATLVPRENFWEIGMPRNDKMINGDAELAEKIRKTIGLKMGERLVLYAPTYRKPEDNYFQESVSIQYGIDPKMVCAALKERFGGQWKFGLRLHPCITNKEDYMLDDVIDLSTYEDMQDLLLVSDVMINDFSSSMWDFMLTGRPCFLFAKDRDHYIETTEVYTPVEEWPFPFATSNTELQKMILEFDEDKYVQDCKNNYEKLGGCETGRATELLVEKIIEICGEDRL